MDVNPRSATSLGGRMVLATLGFCLLFTVAVVAVRTWMAWQNNIDRMSGEISLIAQVYQRTLSKSIWEMDYESLQTHTTSIANALPVGQVVVTLASSSQMPELFQQTRRGWLPSTRAPVQRTELDFEAYSGAKKEIVGALALYGDERVLWSRLRDEMQDIIITQIAQSMLLASLIMLLFNRLVTVHVRRIAQHLGQLTPGNLDLPLSLQRFPERKDELALLVSGVNQLQSNLSDYLQRQLRDEKELLTHRDHLADLVRARTTELEDANALLDGLARTDPLTGLANRRHFDQVKEVELRRALRNGHPLSLIVCDIDHFKRYNDSYGHPAGDQCLREVATAMRTSCARAGDLVARIGGEEFAVLLPGSDALHAHTLASQLRQAVANLGIPHRDSSVAPYITVSVGLAQLDPERVSDFNTLFEQADKALYQAKSQGRNRVVVHGEPLA